jgi:hypothetical protein
MHAQREAMMVSALNTHLVSTVSILRQSRRLYDCWHLKGAFSQSKIKNSKPDISRQFDRSQKLPKVPTAVKVKL